MTEITKAVQWLKNNLPALQALADESEKLGDLRADAKALQTEIKALTSTRDQVRGDVEATRASMAAGQLKVKEEHATAEKVAVARLEDLQRQQRVLEDQLVAVRTKIAHETQEADKSYVVYAEKVEQARRDVVKAHAELATAQAKIKALHEHLAGASTTG